MELQDSTHKTVEKGTKRDIICAMALTALPHWQMTTPQEETLTAIERPFQATTHEGGNQTSERGCKAKEIKNEEKKKTRRLLELKVVIQIRESTVFFCSDEKARTLRGRRLGSESLNHACSFHPFPRSVAPLHVFFFHVTPHVHFGPLEWKAHREREACVRGAQERGA